MKLCSFAHLPLLGGAERTLLELVEQLIQDYGVDCTVVVPGQGPLVPRLEMAGARVLRTDYEWWCTAEDLSAGDMRRRVGMSLAKLYREIVPLLEQLDPDLICTETIVIPYGALAAASLRKPHIWNIREYGEGDGLRFMMPFETVAEFMRDHSDFFFGVNRRICHELVPGLRPDDSDVLYPAITVPSAPRREPRCRERNALRICEFATINGKRRLDIAIAAVAELVNRGRDVELMIAGDQDGEHVSELRQLAESAGIRGRVEIRGFMSDVFSAMAECDAVVVSAPVHGLGRTAVEGALFGIPVVYPLGTGFDDFMDDGITGLGYAAGDPLAMAARIDELIRNPERAIQLCRRAQDRARKMFTKENFSGKFYRKSLELLGRQRSFENEAYRGFLEALGEAVADRQQHALNLERIVASRDAEISSLKAAAPGDRRGEGSPGVIDCER